MVFWRGLGTNFIFGKRSLLFRILHDTGWSAVRDPANLEPRAPRLLSQRLDRRPRRPADGQVPERQGDAKEGAGILVSSTTVSFVFCDEDFPFLQIWRKRLIAIKLRLSKLLSGFVPHIERSLIFTLVTLLVYKQNCWWVHLEKSARIVQVTSSVRIPFGWLSWQVHIFAANDWRLIHVVEIGPYFTAHFYS